VGGNFSTKHNRRDYLKKQKKGNEGKHREMKGNKDKEMMKKREYEDFSHCTKNSARGLLTWP
jgi:hypothetical protein